MYSSARVTGRAIVGSATVGGDPSAHSRSSRLTVGRRLRPRTGRCRGNGEPKPGCGLELLMLRAVQNEFGIPLSSASTSWSDNRGNGVGRFLWCLKKCRLYRHNSGNFRVKLRRRRATDQQDERQQERTRRPQRPSGSSVITMGRRAPRGMRPVRQVAWTRERAPPKKTRPGKFSCAALRRAATAAAAAVAETARVHHR